MSHHILLSTSVVLFFVMFIYSGINKIKNFDKKSKTLSKKINTSEFVSKIGMICVILLEILASLYLIFYVIFKSDKKDIFYVLAIIAIIAYLIFMIVVTIIYHPPGNKLIPFLSNVTTFSGFLLLFYIILK